VSADICGRAALVTGAGNGLGRGITLALAQQGARVVVVGRDAGKLQTVADEVREGGGVARVLVCDVAVPSSVADAARELADDEISILINNAGVPGPVAPLVDVAAEDWDDVFATNVRGVYLMCRAFLPAMIRRAHGDVINIASVSGKRPLAGRTPYAASKMAVIGLTATLAHEVGPLGVRVNTLSPGPVRGPRMERNFRLEADRRGISADQAEQEFVSRSALHRMVTEEEVARAVIAMLSMSGMCGADIDLSAGMVARC
jgi:NAD(P)-dependent dehydrogenase (short-subunit alcohol dehydrogenase family)